VFVAQVYLASGTGRMQNHQPAAHELLNVLLRHTLKTEAESSFEMFVSAYELTVY
jgi:hypothetical protein